MVGLVENRDRAGGCWGGLCDECGVRERRGGVVKVTRSTLTSAAHPGQRAHNPVFPKLNLAAGAEL
jgi:hypothetical protein